MGYGFRPFSDLDMFENYSISTFVNGFSTHNKVKVKLKIAGGQLLLLGFRHRQPFDLTLSYHAFSLSYL
jgi:hypothetical protein